MYLHTTVIFPTPCAFGDTIIHFSVRERLNASDGKIDTKILKYQLPYILNFGTKYSTKVENRNTCIISGYLWLMGELFQCFVLNLLPAHCALNCSTSHMTRRATSCTCYPIQFPREDCLTLGFWLLRLIVQWNTLKCADTLKKKWFQEMKSLCFGGKKHRGGHFCYWVKWQRTISELLLHLFQWRVRFLRQGKWLPRNAIVANLNILMCCCS